MYIEKFVENPRHIEFQILGDKFGNVIYLRRKRLFNSKKKSEGT